VDRAIRRSGLAGPVDVCLAGGVGANILMNRCIVEMPNVRRLFVFPNMGDGGLAVGAAADILFERSGVSKISFNLPYLGTETSDSAVASAIQKLPSEYTCSDAEADKSDITADLIGKKIVGYYQGRAEFGPRALGARSILFDASSTDHAALLNSRLGRNGHMPFGPVIPAGLANHCLIGWKHSDLCSPYMTRSFACTDQFKEKHPAAVHIDGTVRPQVVNKDASPDFYDVVSSYCTKTGQSALINTSLNLHGLPIVNTPETACAALIEGALDVLYMSKYRIERE